MPIIKEVIKSNGNDTTIKFALGVNNSLSGYQQEIDELTEETKDDLINPIIDNEVRRYSYSGTLTTLGFYFATLSPQFTNAGFTTSEIDSSDTKLLNSFFILDFYDKYDPYTQTKIFTTYLTQVLDGNTQGGTPIPIYNISDNKNQYYYLYIPKSYLDAQTGTTVTAYIKISFYNAKTGRLSLSYNKDNDGLTTPEKMYFKTILNLTNMTWEIVELTGFFGDSAKAYEIISTNAYSERVNEALDNFDNQQQDYPDGNVFDSEDGTYHSTT